MALVMLLQLAATLFMTGLIWFVQVVHYPLFARVGAEQFTAYERIHQRLTTWVVGPAMGVEMATSLALLLRPPIRIAVGELWLGFGLVLLIWVSTGLLQVPMHQRLENGFDPAAHRFLVRSNWLRTVLWSARAGLVLSWLLPAAA